LDARPGQGMVDLWSLSLLWLCEKCPSLNAGMLGGNVDGYLYLIYHFFLIPIQNVDHFIPTGVLIPKVMEMLMEMSAMLLIFYQNLINAPDPAGQFLIHQARAQPNYKFEMIPAYTNQLLLPLLLLCFIMIIIFVIYTYLLLSLL
jgi:hypothetical protein